MECTHTNPSQPPSVELTLSPANTVFPRDSAESDRKRKRAQEDKYKMGDGEDTKEDGTMKDGDGREPEAKKKKQSRIDTSSDSEEGEEGDDDDDDNDEEASMQSLVGMQQLSLTDLRIFFHHRKTKAERNTQKWTKRCAG